MKSCAEAGCSWPVFGKGYCKKHQYKRPDYDKRTAYQKFAGQEKDTELEKWFASKIKVFKSNPVCWECGEKVVDPAYYRAAIAHLFPKKIFPSVKTHPLNFAFLPASCCHNKTHTWSGMREMKIFPKLLERMASVVVDMDEYEKKNLPGFLLEYIEQSNPF